MKVTAVYFRALDCATSKRRLRTLRPQLWKRSRDTSHVRDPLTPTPCRGTSGSGGLDPSLCSPPRTRLDQFAVPMQRSPSLGVIFLTVLLDLLGFGLVMPFLSLEARDVFGVDELTAALLGACYSAMQFLFMPLWGRLSDRIGRRPVMLISIAFFGAGHGRARRRPWLGPTPSLWLFLARALSGSATANIGTASAYIADITTPEERVKGMGLIGMAFGIGFMIGPGVGGLLTEHPHQRPRRPARLLRRGRAQPHQPDLGASPRCPSRCPRSGAPEPEQARSLSPLRVAALRRAARHARHRPRRLTNGLIILAFSGLEITYALYASGRVRPARSARWA